METAKSASALELLASRTILHSWSLIVS